MQDVTKNLLFLLAAAPMATGCIVPSDDTGDDETTGDGDGDPTTTTGDGDGDPTTGDGDGDPTTGDGDGDPTTGDGDGDPTTTGDGDGDGVCSEYAAKYAECYGARYYQEALTYCSAALDYYNSVGAECLSAYEGWLVCLSALDCEALMQPDPCPNEVAELESACGGSGLVDQFVVRHR